MTASRHRTAAPRLAFRELGSGPDTVVLLHSLGADGRMWDAAARLLGRRYRLVVPDSRGHGRSPGGHGASVQAWVEDLEALLTDLAADRVSLVGVSLGGIQALAHAAAHPDRVTALVVADSFAALAPDVAEAKIATLAGAARDLPMPQVADRYVADTFTAPLPEGAEAVRSALGATDPDDYAAAAAACFGVRIEHLLHTITAPTLVLWGDRDTKTPRVLSETICRGIAGARLDTVPDAGHLSNVDNPEAFARLVGGFLGEVAARAQPTRGGHRHG